MTTLSDYALFAMRAYDRENANQAPSGELGNLRRQSTTSGSGRCIR